MSLKNPIGFILVIAGSPCKCLCVSGLSQAHFFAVEVGEGDSCPSFPGFREGRKDDDSGL